MPTVLNGFDGPTGSLLTHLECAKTGKVYDADTLQNLSEAGAPLLARYDLDKAPPYSRIQNGPPNLWRYAPFLPVRDGQFIRCLGEGWTPLLHVDRVGASLHISHLYIKEESVNPTASFKARGMAVAVARAWELGAKELAVGTAGNAGSALAAYASAMGLTAHVAMPDDTPRAFVAECQAMGVDLALVPGLITDANAHVGKGIRELGWFDIATLREPYRLEGKKTMGYELFEQMRGELPDVILYPTGGGTGLIGMWKAFAEMERMGWIGSTRPRMVSVQADGCAPIVRAFERGETHAEPWQNARTASSGLRVPRAIGDFLILQAVRESGGTAVAVSESETHRAWQEMASRTGVMVAPEGAATLAALHKLLERGLVERNERVVLFNTGSGLKYLEAWFNPMPDNAQSKLGVTP
jgi:threonine synthase